MLKPTKIEKLRLGQSIWSWNLCEGCLNERGCRQYECDSDRMKNLKRYWTYYASAIADYRDTAGTCSDGLTESREVIFRALHTIQEQPELTREGLARQASVKPRDIDLSVRLMTMIPYAHETGSFIAIEQATNPIPWGPSVGLDHFVEQALPAANVNVKLDPDQRSMLMARKLRKKTKLCIQPTNDLREHLRLHRGGRAVLVFHHTAFLKEHLRRTKNSQSKLSVNECLKLGAIPRQLALEMLDSIYKVLFPLADRKSKNMLENFVKKYSCDRDILRFESAVYRKPEERDISYLYLGNRLKELLDEVEHPLPHGRLAKVIQRNSASRHMMMASLIGVAIAIILGSLTLIVGMLQTWIAWQQWKHPGDSHPQ